MTSEVDNIRIVPTEFGWRIRIELTEGGCYWWDIGDEIQFHDETQRTIGRWLADGPADFHNADATEPTTEREAH